MLTPVIKQQCLQVGRDRTALAFPLLVLLKVITPFLTEVGPDLSASDQRALVDRQIITIGSTCGLSQPYRMASISSAIWSSIPPADDGRRLR